MSMMTKIFNSGYYWRVYLYASILTLYIIFSVIQGAFYSQIHTDEFWYIYQARSVAENMSVFNHRLPLQSIIYGAFAKVFGGDILTLRMLSVSFFVMSIFTFLYYLIFIKKYSPNHLLWVLIVFCHPFLIEMAGTVTSYSISIFFLTIFIILFEQGKFYQALVPFLSFYLVRYIIDFSILVFPTAALFAKTHKIEYLKLSIIVLLVVSLLFFGGTYYKDTFLFNLGVSDFQIDNGILNADTFARFIHLRKLEILSFFAFIPIGILLLLKLEFGKLLFSKNLLYLIFLFGGIAYYWLTINDYPITKLIFFPFIAILAAKLADSNLISRLVLVLSLIGMLYTPSLIPKNQNVTHSRNICAFVSCDSTSVLSINPIIASEFKSHIYAAPMELYSFAFDHQDQYENLYSSDQFIDLIQNKNPEIIVVDSRLTSRKNMSLVFSDEKYNEILKLLKDKYRLDKSYFDSNFGEDFFIYVRI